MLPEIFAVGNTMQEDFGFLNVNNCYVEKTITTSNSGDSIDLESSTYNKNSVKVKLEDSPDINKWPFNYGTSFLRTSDDPLISSVNNGCEQIDNELLRRDSSSIDNTITLFDNMNTIKNQRKEESHTEVKRVTTRARKKGPLKLRFHHQALPPEYLNHYESQQQNQIQNQQMQIQEKQPVSLPAKKKSQVKLLAPPPVAAIDEKSTTCSDAKKNNEDILNWLQNILEMQKTAKEQSKSVPKTRNVPIELPPVTAGCRTQSLKDLPYMGEMTLENMKPRRGRKPKKADICHLIYKNYGTIIPGSSAESAERKVEETKKKVVAVKKVVKEKIVDNEPLNLCIRETAEDSSILISDDNDSNDFVLPPRIKNLIDPCESDLDFSSQIIPPLDLSNDVPATKEFFTTSSMSSSSSAPPQHHIQWPNAGIFVHPMALYYQKMMNSKLNNDSSESSSTSSLNDSSTTLWDQQNMSPCSIDMRAQEFDIKNEGSPPVLSDMLKNTSLDPHSSSQSQKRKRSAIFIPPVQADISTSPTNEVSICKFKFTGGAKPSLQEKKILSVDAGGNFRYYSGTGDKNMRGYEFFPRESLMQSSLSSSSHTNAFLNTTSEKISLDLPPVSHDLSTKILNLSSDVDSGKLLDATFFNERSCDEQMSRRKKPSSTRSQQRAKLEKTFKEKGFLIQTQQLQSAEGATYCKFRQLKKFTRYLFRSWKDYLPMEEGMTIPLDYQLLNNQKSTSSSSST